METEENGKKMENDIIDGDGWIETIILTKKQHNGMFFMIKGTGFKVEKINDDTYKIGSAEVDKKWSWRYKRNHEKKSIELYRYMGGDWKDPDNNKRKMQLSFDM